MNVQVKYQRNLKLLTWVNFLGSFQLYAAIAIIYYAQVSGSYALGLTVFSISTLTSSIFDLPLGIFSDRTARKTVLCLGITASLLQLIFIALAVDFKLLAIGAIFGGLASALFSGNNNALLHDTAREAGKGEEYSHNLGRITSMTQLALGVATIIGAAIANQSLHLAIQLSIIPIALSLFISLFIIEPELHDKASNYHYLHDLKEAVREFVRNIKLRNLMIGSVLESSLGESSHQFQASFYATFLPIWAIGLAKTATYITGFLGFFYSGKVIKRFKELPSLVFSSVFTRITNLIAYGLPSILSPVLVAANSATFGIASVAKGSLFQQQFSPHQRATMGSLTSVVDNVAFSILGPILGLLADRLSPGIALVIFQVAMIPSVFLFRNLKSREVQN
jgi:MFS family permease